MTDDEMIAAHIASKGVTRCPTRYVAVSHQGCAPEAAPVTAPPPPRGPSELDIEIARIYATEPCTKREISKRLKVSDKVVSGAIDLCGAKKPIDLRRRRRGQDSIIISDTESDAIAYHQRHQPMTIREVSEAFGIRYDRLRKVLKHVGAERLSRGIAGQLACRRPSGATLDKLNPGIGKRRDDGGDGEVMPTGFALFQADDGLHTYLRAGGKVVVLPA